MNKISILIVEDDPIIAADLQDRLEEMGYEIVGPFEKGEEALEVVTSEIPDLVIMDIQLAGKWDGIETTNNIQSKRRMPVIFLTSNSDDATFDKAKLTNPSAFISKPFRGRDLMHAIELSVLQTQNDLPASEKLTMNIGQSLLFNDSIFLKNKDRLERYYFKDIMWVEADDYYCKLHTKYKNVLLTQTLSKFEEKIIDKSEFIRTHRSFIVNLNFIEQIGDTFMVIGENKIPISKTFKSELMKRINKL